MKSYISGRGKPFPFIVWSKLCNLWITSFLDFGCLFVFGKEHNITGLDALPYSG